MSGYDWRRYVPVAERRQRAAKRVAKLRQAGRKVEPIEIEGRKIATTFWGLAWCDNLEAYSDYANRLPRGRTYLRNGSVIDLQIASRRISALVSGSDFYDVELVVDPLAARKWKRIRTQCAGEINSLVEILQGQISQAVMQIVTRPREGLFPTPREISFACSCPDWATMCKHVAAVLYGVGARLDHAPELLFALRGVDAAEMVAEAVGHAPTRRPKGRGRVLATDDLSSVFGVDIDMGDADADKKRAPSRRRRGSSAQRGSGRPETRRKASATKSSRGKVSRKKSDLGMRAARSAAKKTGTKKKKATKEAGRKRAAAYRKVSASKKTAAKKRVSRKAPA